MRRDLESLLREGDSNLCLERQKSGELETGELETK